MAQSDGYSKCACQHCGGHIAFPSDGAGRTITCPHCNWPTLLVGEAAPAAAANGPGGAKMILRVLAIVAVVLIAAGAGGYWYLLKTGRKLSWPPSTATPVVVTPAPASNPAPVPVIPVAPPDPWHGLMAGPVALEKSGDGHLVYAVGILRNSSDHERYGIKVELDVFNADHQKVGTATDYVPSIQSGKEWKFRALVVDRTAASAELTSVKEN